LWHFVNFHDLTVVRLMGAQCARCMNHRPMLAADDEVLFVLSIMRRLCI